MFASGSRWAPLLMQVDPGHGGVEGGEPKQRPSASEVHSSFSALLRSQHAELLDRFDELIALQTTLLSGHQPLRPALRKAASVQSIAPTKPPLVAPPPPRPPGPKRVSAFQPRLLQQTPVQPAQPQPFTSERSSKEEEQAEAEPEPTSPKDVVARPSKESFASSPAQSAPLSPTLPPAKGEEDILRSTSDNLDHNQKENRSSTLTEINTSENIGMWGSTTPKKRTSLVSTVSRKASRFMARMSRADLDEVDAIDFGGSWRHVRTGTNLDIAAALKQRHSNRDAPRWRRYFQNLVASECFEGTMAFLIIMNVAYVGAEVEHDAQHASRGGAVFDVFKHFFASVFMLELTLRYMAAGWVLFFTDTNNLFDTFLVVTSLFEIIAAGLEAVTETADDLAGLRVIRIVRICRLLRLLRIARVVRVVRPLRMLVHSIFSTLKSLIWALILLGIIIYMFSIIFTQSVTDFIKEDSQITAIESTALRQDWGRLATSMFTLYLIVTNGRDWYELVDSLATVDPGLIFVLLVYISFIYFAVLNVVTGVFCQTAIESAQHDRDLMMQSMLQNREEFLDRVKHQFGDMFQIFGEGGKDGVNFSEFESHINDPSVQAYLALMELNSADAWGLFQLLGNDETNSVDVEDFVDGCLRLKGGARSIDLALMRKENRIQVRKLRNELQEDLQAILKMVAAMTSEVDHLKTVSLSTLTTVGVRHWQDQAYHRLLSPEEDARPPQPKGGSVMSPGATLHMTSSGSSWKRDQPGSQQKTAL